MEETPLLYTEAQAAKLLNLSTKTLSRIRKEGKLHFLKIGRAIRYDLATLLAWIDVNRVLA